MNYNSEYLGYPSGIPPDFDPKELMKNLTDEQLLEIVKGNPEVSSPISSYQNNTTISSRIS